MESLVHHLIWYGITCIWCGIKWTSFDNSKICISKCRLTEFIIITSNICDFCDEIDYIDHSFYSCRHVKEFWNYISSIISTSLNTRFDLTVSHALLGLPIGTLQLKSREIKEINHFILVAKLAITKSKAAKSRNFENIFWKWVWV